MKEIMEKLVKEGYESYIVGGYVRDYLLGFTSDDVDICTNAPIDEIIKIFKGRGTAFKDYYAYHINEDGISYTITTYRKELEYKKNKPVKLEIAKNLGTDLLRRDFTINTFAIDKNGYLIDMLGAKKDLDSRIIKVVGDINKKFEEDKTRILRAIRLSCVLDFDLDPDIINYLSNHDSHLFKDVSNDFKKKELDRIFDSSCYNKFFYLSRRYNLDRYLGLSYTSIKDVYNRYGIWAQVETTLPLSKKEKRIIDNINLLVNKGDIGINDVDIYSDDVILNAANILGIVDKLTAIKEMKSMNYLFDIDISIDIMLRYVNVRNFKKVYKLIERNIMEGNLDNNNDDIILFLKKM